MPKKQNKTSKNSSLKQKKNPKEIGMDLNFSITKNAINTDAHGSSLNGYEYRKMAQEKEAREDEKRKSFFKEVNQIDDKINKQGAKMIKQIAHKLSINKKQHKQSPYVVRLLEDGKAPYSESIIEPESKNDENHSIKQSQDNASWIKEVERLRKGAQSAYKASVNRIYINLLGQSEEKHKKEKIKIHAKDIPRVSLEYFIAALRAIIRWIFEFILSIPLGFLLAFQVLLKFVEFVNKWAMKGGRAAGKGASLAIEQVIFIILAILKGLIVIPIKLITIFFLTLYRIISIIGSGILWLGNGVYEGMQNYFKVFIHPPQKFKYKVLAIAIISIIVILPVKFLYSAPQSIRFLEGKVLGATKEGYSAMQNLPNAVSQGQADAANEQLELANQKFSEARANIDSLNIFVKGIINVLPQGQDGLHAISAGEDLTESAQLVAKALSPVAGNQDSDMSAVELIASMQHTLSKALPSIKSALSHLSEIDSDNLPDEYKQKFIKARLVLPDIQAAISDFDIFADVLLSILGADEQKRYAVLFQNNNELRPSGGFIGSLAFIDVRHGKIENIEIPGGGPYDFQGYLTESVLAPKPLRILNARWELQDANWYADWPTSAEKVAWFIEKSSHSSVDGVIAMQATTLVELLNTIGPIVFEEHDIILDSENVIDEMQMAVEINYDKAENQPKKYVAQLVPRVLDKILSSSGAEFLRILSLVKSEIKEKNILLYFRDNEVNEQIIARGWESSILDSDMDYLSVVHANIGGGKTDGVIAQTYNQEITISEDGTAIAELTIVRRHEGDADHLFEGVNNVDFARVYVPEGSELISFEGVKPPPETMFEQSKDYFMQDYELNQIEQNPIIHEKTGTRITQEFNKTVFGNWLQVDPGNSLFAKVKYKLPFKVKPYDVFNPNIKSGYSLLMQKQAGARAIDYSVSLKFPSAWQIKWQKQAADNVVKVLGPGLAVFEGKLIQDTGFAVIFTE